MNLPPTNPFSIDTSFIDLRATASQLQWVNVLDLIGNTKYAVVRATWGTGKTYSMNAIAHEALFISHRLSIVSTKHNFKSSMCINTFSESMTINRLKEYKYIVIDEMLGVLDSFAWLKVNYLNTINLLDAYNGKIIALDASATAESTKLMSELCNKPFEFFEHKTGNRNKHIGFTRNLNTVYERGMAFESGIRFLIFDTRTKAEACHKSWLVGDAKKYCINPTNSYKAMQIVDEAAKLDSAWIFATPCVQEGLSIEHLNYVYTAYIHHGNKPNFLRPIDKGMQSIHRVRNKSAEINVCLISWCEEQPITEQYILAQLRCQYAEALNKTFEYTIYLDTKTTEQKSQDFFTDSGRDAGFQIFAHHRAITNIQNGHAESEWEKALLDAGYDIFLLDDAESEIPFDDNIAKDLEQDYSLLEQLVIDLPIRSLLQLSSNIDGFVDETKGYTMQLAKTRSKIAMHCGIDKANDPYFIAHFYDENGPNHRLYNLIKLRAIDPYNTQDNTLFGYKYSLANKYVYTILQDAMGKEQWADFGINRDRANIVINKHDVYNHPLFSKLAKEYGITDIAQKSRHTWFWNKCLRKTYKLDFKRFGYGLVKYKLQNDLSIGSVKVHKWQIHAKQDSYENMQKQYPEAFADLWYWAKTNNEAEFGIINQVAISAGLSEEALLQI